jgi:hypothetical protein
MEKSENTTDPLWLIESALRNMEVSFNGRLIQSLPEILVAAPLGFQEIQTGAFRQAKLECPGFQDAMTMALEGGRLTKPQWGVLSRFLQGESIDSENFTEVGLTPFIDGLDRYNCLQVVRTVAQGLNVLGFKGMLLVLNEKEPVLTSHANSLKDRLTAARIQEMVEFCVKGSVPGLTLVWTVLPGFLGACADLRPAVESKWFIMPGRQQISSRRWPIMSVEDALTSGELLSADMAAGGSEDRLNALEALRYGMVPEQNLRELTQGMDGFEIWARGCLAECGKGPSGFEITGRPGEGRTHSLALIRQMAREKGFLTLSVSLDDLEKISFANPAGFMSKLWKSAGGGSNNTGTPLLDLHMKANVSGVRSEGPYFCNSLKQNLSVIQSLAEKGRMDQYAGLVEKMLTVDEHASLTQNIEMPPLIQNPAARRGARKHEALLDGLGYYANLAQIAGLNGLVVTVDGFETEYRNSNQRLQLAQTMNLLGSYFRKELDLLPVPLGLFVSSADYETELSEDMVKEMVASRVWELKGWDSDRRVRLAEKIRNVYCRAYQWAHEFDEGFIPSIEQAVMKRLGESSSSLTCFIKIFIGILDTEAVK